LIYEKVEDGAEGVGDGEGDGDKDDDADTGGGLAKALLITA
jgi:hypothetical protein